MHRRRGGGWLGKLTVIINTMMYFSLFKNVVLIYINSLKHLNTCADTQALKSITRRLEIINKQTALLIIRTYAVVS